MNDFLTNLAARALHTAPVVQPRLASRFEPPPAGERFFQDDSFAGEAESFSESATPAAAPTTVADSALQMRTRAKRGDLDAAHVKPLPPRGEPAANESRRALARASSHAPSPRETNTESTSTIVVKTVIERPAPIDRVPHSIADESSKSPNPGLPAVPAPVADIEHERQPLRDAFQVESTPFPDPPRPAEPVARSDTKTAAGREIVVTPRVTPAPVSSPPVARRDRAPEPAPVVHVTIGRIEVRAVTASATALPAAPRPAAKSPVLSLDDYLRERNGGRQ
jgi:hypothetical protein